MSIPKELRERAQWCCSRSIKDKKPRMPDGTLASVTDPSTWSTYEACVQSALPLTGYVFHPDDPHTGIDLDNHVDNPATKEQKKRFKKIMKRAGGSYTEKSISGRGVHIIVRAKAEMNFHRDNIELYSGGKYFILTGDSLNGTKIARRQKLVSTLCREYATIRAQELVGNQAAAMSDERLVEMARGAENGLKFDRLCRGGWQGEYPSQSEADLALFSMLCYYSKDNEQVKRIFHTTALGMRDKAHKPHYLEYNLQRARSQEPPPIDLSRVVENLLGKDEKDGESIQASTGGMENTERRDGNTRGVPEKTRGQESDESVVDLRGHGCGADDTDRCRTIRPSGLVQPGLLGDIAGYITESAIRPIIEIGVVGSRGLLGGICGGSINNSNTGLNTYQILAAKTGMGKEGLANGIDRLISACSVTMPSITQRIGPAHFASGPAILKYLVNNSCFVSVLGEFGIELQLMSDPRAHAAEKTRLKVLLALYAKSGEGNVLRSAVYSDADKNTVDVIAPAVSIIGEGTPESIFENMDDAMISSGLMPRFSIIQYHGDRVAENKNAFFAPPAGLVKDVIALAERCARLEQQQKVVHVKTDADAQRIMDDFSAHCDAVINRAENNNVLHMWNRTSLKGLKLGAIGAVGESVSRRKGVPTVTKALAQWACDEINREVRETLRTLHSGVYSAGNARQESEVLNAMEGYAKLSTAKRRSFKVAKSILDKPELIPFEYLRRKTRGLKSFRDDRRGPVAALRELMRELVDSGIVFQLSHKEVFEEHRLNAPVYMLDTEGVKR